MLKIGYVIAFIIMFLIGKYSFSDGINNKTDTENMYREEATFQNYTDLMKKGFKNSFKGKIYYNIYGKKAYEYETSLDLSDVIIDDNLEKKIAILSCLQEVNLHNQDISNERIVALEKEFPNIAFKWDVNISGGKYDCYTTDLDLSNTIITNIEELKESIKFFPNLKSIDFSYTNLSNEELDDLRKTFPNIRIDWVVSLGKWKLRTDAVAFSVLVTRFDYKRMTSDDIQVLKYCTNLQALDIGHQAITDISVIGDYLPNLRVLILADNRIRDISPLAKLKHLHYLELFMNNITDLTPLANCKEMVDLNISFNYNLWNINGILDYPMLERLWLIHDRISWESYEFIRQRYPYVKLITEGNGSTGSGWRTHRRYFDMIDMYRNNYISESFTKYDRE